MFPLRVPFLSLLFSFAFSQSFNRFESSQCVGIYGPNKFLGEKSQLQVEIQPNSNQGSLAIAIFIFEDRYNIQAMETKPDFLICTQVEVENGICMESELNKFHVKQLPATAEVLNEFILWNNTNPIALNYSIEKTGYFCAFISSADSTNKDQFEISLIASQPYGKLPAIFYPALPFYVTFSILYTFVGVAWIALSFLYWKV
jgi:hypothetical protein